MEKDHKCYYCQAENNICENCAYLKKQKKEEDFYDVMFSLYQMLDDVFIVLEKMKQKKSD